MGVLQSHTNGSPRRNARAAESRRWLRVSGLAPLGEVVGLDDVRRRGFEC